MDIERRTFFSAVGALTLGACAHRRSSGHARAAANRERSESYLNIARDAATFIRTQRIRTTHGHIWRKSPDEPGVTTTDMYHGSAGIVVFSLEMYRATGDVQYLDDARLGAAHIRATMPETPSTWQLGLFGGIAGHAFVFTEMFRTTGDQQWRDAARAAVTILDRVATSTQRGGAHYAGITDIMFGSAGVIVALLDLADAGLDERGVGLARRLGIGLAQHASRQPHGHRWLMMPGDEYAMPNFSHGTAGVAYALARLYEQTGEQQFLDLARSGATHLVSLAHTAHDTFLVPHVIPDAARRYYLSWCHGPAGTWRLLYKLFQVTDDASWETYARRSVDSVLRSGIPELQTPGFWDNVGQCCGSAGVAEMYLSRYQISGQQRYLDAARDMIADVLARASRDRTGSGPSAGVQWIHAENRTEPYWKQSYTGYKQGAAGIGSLLVGAAGLERGEAWKIRLPDEPPPVRVAIGASHS